MGALMMSRAVHKANPELSAEMLRDVQESIMKLLAEN